MLKTYRHVFGKSVRYIYYVTHLGWHTSTKRRYRQWLKSRAAAITVASTLELS